MAASIKIPTIFTAENKFSGVLNSMGRDLKSFAKTGTSAVNRLDQKITGGFKKMSNLAQVALGLSIGAVFMQGFNDVTQFETGLVGVSKTTEIVGSDLKKLGQDTLNYSNKLRGVSTHKLLELEESAGQLGVKGSADILKFAGTLAKLEKASDVQGAEGASNIVRLLTLTGEGVGVVDRFSSALVNLGNNSAATEGEILGVSSEVARSVAAYKFTSAEILGVSTALKSLDVRPEAAGTAVGKVMRGIELATIKGGKQLEGFSKIMGMTPKEVKKAFAESPQKSFNMFIKGLQKVSDEGGSVAESLIGVGLSGETVSKGIIPLATNYSLLEEKMKLANDGFKDNLALNKEFDAASATVQTALDSVKNSWSNVIISQATAGSGLSRLQTVLFFVADNMETVVAVGAGLVASFALMKAIVWGTQAAVFAYNVVMGVSAVVTGGMTRAIATNGVALVAYKVAMGVSTAVTWLATAATTAFGIALNLSIWPILLIVAAIAAVIAIIMNWSAISDWFIEQWDKFTSFIGAAWAALVDWFTNFDFKAMFVDIGQSILKYMLMPLKMMLTLLSNVPGKIGNLAKLGLEKIDEVTGEVKVGAEGLPSTTQASNENVSKSISEKNSNVNLNIVDKGGNIGSIENNDNVPIKIGSTVADF
ncbi:tail length tape-measure protein [Cellulophaga phage phi38:2]|nr:tail length tape-measure protein [Cellulophaga phage phi38:2]